MTGFLHTDLIVRAAVAALAQRYGLQDAWEISTET
jgi:hypothetical protein